MRRRPDLIATGHAHVRATGVAECGPAAPPPELVSRWCAPARRIMQFVAMLAAGETSYPQRRSLDDE
jgi:hypothetical protein